MSKAALELEKLIHVLSQETGEGIAHLGTGSAIERNRRMATLT